MQQIVLDIRLIAVDDLEQWHDRIRRWSRRWRGELTAEPRRVVAEASAAEADMVLELLISELLEPADVRGSVLAVGIGAGEEAPLRVADGRTVRSGRAAEEAEVVADAAVPGQVLLSGSARVALIGDWSFGGRRVLDVKGGIAAHELQWQDDNARGSVPTRRMRGTVSRIEPDWTTVIAGDDGLSYWAQSHDQLARASGPSTIVWFVRARALVKGRPRAAAMVPVGATLTGTVQRRGPEALFRSQSPSGFWMTFLATSHDPEDTESLRPGEMIRFRVGDGPSGPAAAEILPASGVASPTVVERLLAACMDELARHGSGGAAAAVRRSTKNISSDAESTLEEQRVWLALDHAAGAWLLPALGLLPNRGGEVGHVVARDAVGTRDSTSARRLSERLGELLRAEVISTEGRDLRPLLSAIRMAADHAARIIPNRRLEDVDHLARAATLLGEALAQALLCGVIRTAPAEAKHLARRLATLRSPSPEAAPDAEHVSDAQAESDTADRADNEVPAEAAIGAVAALVAHARDHVLPRLTSDDPYRYVIPVALFARSVSLVESVLVLAEAGHGREMIMLNRPLFESMVDAYWAAIDPERAERRFVAQARHTQHLRGELAQTRLDLFPEAASAQSLDEAELRELEKTFGRHGQRSWTGLGLRARVDEVALMFEDAAEQLQLSYNIHNQLANAELHSTSWSLARGLRRVRTADGSERIQVRVGPEPELVVTALQQTWWVFGHHLGLIHRLAGIDLEPLWEVSDSGASAMGFGAEP